MAKGAATRVVSSRVYFMRSGRIPVRLDEKRGIGLTVVPIETTVAALARLEVDDRLEQVTAAEVGPENLGDVNFCVGDLPEEEIRDAQLAAGADEQVGVDDPGGVEVIGEEALVDGTVAHLALAQHGHDAVHAVDDLRASAVVEGDLEQQAGVRLGGVLGVAELALHARVEAVDAADGREADVVLHE